MKDSNTLSISVLYIHHTGTFGGASRSLLEMIRAFPFGSVRPYLITQKGHVAKIFKEEGIPVIDTLGISQFDNTRYGYYRKYRWFILIREFIYGFFTLHSIVRARRKWKNIDIIHVNEMTNILSIVLCHIFFKKPVIVHCRSVQQNETARLRCSFINSILDKYANYVIAVDKTVKKSLQKNLKIAVVHNGLNMDNWDESVNGKNLEALLNAPQGYLKVAMVGNLFEFKGVYEFIEAAKICIQKKFKILFFLIGGNPGIRNSMTTTVLEKFKFFHNVELDAKKIIQKYRMGEYIYIIEFNTNIHKFYKNIDILCFPSHLNAIGRPVLEAALFKVPSIVAIDKPSDDTIIDHSTGICIKSKDPKSLADAIEYFYLRPEEIQRMGGLAYKLAIKNFDIIKNSKKILEIYKQHV